MRFEHNGDSFALSFRREYRDRINEKGDTVKSTKPYTTVELYKQEGDKFTLFRTATVGCWHKDDYRLEKGRLGALRFLSKGNSLSQEFKAAMWKSYMERPRGLTPRLSPEEQKAVAEAFIAESEHNRS